MTCSDALSLLLMDASVVALAASGFILFLSIRSIKK